MAGGRIVMGNQLKLGAAVAVVLLVTAIGFLVFGRPVTPPAVPSAAPSPAPSSVSSATPTLHAVVPTTQSSTTLPSNPPTPTPMPTPTPLPTPTPIRTAWLPPSTEPGASEPAHLDLDVDYGFWADGDGTGYAVVIHNPNEGLAPRHVETYFNFYDESGLIGSRHGTVSGRRLSPGDAVAGLGVFSPSGTVRIDVVVAATEWREARPRVYIEFANVFTTSERDGTYTTSGRTRSPPGQNLHVPSLHVLTIYFDDRHEIVGGDEVVIDHLGGGQFEIRSSMTLPEGASTELFWSWPAGGL